MAGRELGVDGVVDVAVIGAGPAGSTAAFLAARRGFRVALVDKQQFPRDKSCGDGISPAAVKVLERVGLHSVFDGEIPVSAVDAHGPDAEYLSAELPLVKGERVHGYVVPRTRFDARLRDAALAAGAVDLAGNRFVATGCDRESRWFTLRGADGERRLRTRLLVGADGAYSTVRRSLGLAMNGPRHNGIAMRAYATTDAFDAPAPAGFGRLVFDLGRDLLPAYGWVFPTSKSGVVNVGVGIDLDEMRRRDIKLRQLLDRFVVTNKDRGILLEEPHSYRSHHLPHAAAIPKLAHPRAVLIGDAASMINSVSGEGIGYGLAAAEDLVGCLPAGLTDARSVEQGLALFESTFRGATRLHFLSCAVAHRLLRYPRWASFIIKAAEKDPHVLEGVVEMLFGTGRIKLGTTARILRKGW